MVNDSRIFYNHIATITSDDIRHLLQPAVLKKWHKSIMIVTVAQWKFGQIMRFQFISGHGYFPRFPSKTQDIYKIIAWKRTIDPSFGRESSYPVLQIINKDIGWSPTISPWGILQVDFILLIQHQEFQTIFHQPHHPFTQPLFPQVWWQDTVGVSKALRNNTCWNIHPMTEADQVGWAWLWDFHACSSPLAFHCSGIVSGGSAL